MDDVYMVALRKKETKEKKVMKATGIILIIWGIIGVLMGCMMFGDIGIACLVGAVASILAGIGLLNGAKRLKRLEEEK